MGEHLIRNSDLTVVATYRRAIGASLERVWENVLDWEHLPWLHSGSFADIKCIDAGDWGWRAQVRSPGSEALTNIELLTEPAAGRYVTRVLDGPGAGGEVWTGLTAAGPDTTEIVVEFCAQVPEGATADSLGAGYVSLYEGLWDEDEAMMQHRQVELDREREASACDSEEDTVELGTVKSVAEGLPLQVMAFGSRVQVVELAGEWIVHSLTCPHSLGPLDESEIEDGEIECPWHGYRFDVKTGRSCDGRGLRMRCPATLEVDEAADRVRLVRKK